MTDASNRIQTAYDEWAAFYNDDSNPTRDLSARALRNASLPWDDARVLDVGCGTGYNTAHIAAHADEVVGVDFSKNMLRHARKQVGDDHVQFMHGDITGTWPLADASFDIVVATLVLEHLESVGHVLDEAYRVLAHGGLFYLAELHPYKQLLGSQAKYTHPDTGEDVLIDAYPHATSDYLNEALASGFSLCHMGEWQNDGEALPRLLTLLFEKDD